MERQVIEAHSPSVTQQTTTQIWSRYRRPLANAGALLGYVLATLVFHWPLPRQLGTAFTGPVTGDTGSYVWNLWVFRHEIVANGRFPLFTREILSVTPPVDLSLHNYTLFANLLAFPLIPVLGVTATFNVVFLALTTLTAWTMFLLARRLVKRTPEAWLAGLLFAFSPILVARSIGHFSLTQAAPLPVFVLCLMRAETDYRPRHAVAAGATIAWAAMCDVYFGVYCLLIGMCYVAVKPGWVRLRDAGPAGHRGVLHVIDGMILGATVLVAAIALTGGTTLRLIGHDIGLKSLYTPVLVLTLLAIVRLVVRLRPVLVLPPIRTVDLILRWVGVAAASCLLLLSPVLYALWWRWSDGGTFHQRFFWRSSPRGIDLLALFMPNPNHKLFGAPWRAWLTSQDGGYVENVAALTVVALVVIVMAMWRYRFRPPRFWPVLTVFFGALALGPFVHIGGANTFVPGPWAFMRYVPILSATRAPARFAIVMMMAFSVIFALALAHIADRMPNKRRMLLSVVGLILAFELAPLPRRAPAAPIPAIYRIIAADPRDVTVLGIPFGISDGEGSEGRFSAASLFYQTFHQKRIVGGALSRITENERQRMRRFPVLRTLLRLSDGRSVDEGDVEEANRSAAEFVRSARLGYVVVDRVATSPELRQFTIRVFRLVKVGESDGRELYRPTVADVDRVTSDMPGT